MHQVLTGELLNVLMLCEMAVTTEEPFFSNGNKTSQPQESLPALTPAGREKIEIAARVLSEFVPAMPASSYKFFATTQQSRPDPLPGGMPTRLDEVILQEQMESDWLMELNVGAATGDKKARSRRRSNKKKR